MKTLTEFENYLIGMKQLKKSTAKTYCGKLETIQKTINKKIEDITNKEYQNYFIKIKDKKSINSQRLEQVSIKVFWQWYSDLSGRTNPVYNLRLIKRETISPSLFSREEFVEMIKACGTKSFNSLRNAAILCLMADTGIRVGELIQLKVGHIEKEKNRFFLKVVLDNKTYRQRRIPFCELIEHSLIAEYWTAYWLYITIKEKYEQEDPLFKRLKQSGHGEGGFITEGNIQKLVQRIVKNAGITKNITPHSFRHFYATYCVLNGLRLEILQLRMGHKDITSTMIYVHLADNVKEDSLKYNPLRNVKVPFRNFKGFVKGIQSAKEINNA